MMIVVPRKIPKTQPQKNRRNCNASGFPVGGAGVYL